MSMAPQRTIQSLFGEFCIELSASPYITALAGILPSMTVAGAVLEPPYDVATALCGEGVVRHSTTSRHGSRSVHKELGSDSIVFNDESWREQLDIVGTQIQSVLSPQSDIVQTEFCRYLMCPPHRPHQQLFLKTNHHLTHSARAHTHTHTFSYVGLSNLAV